MIAFCEGMYKDSRKGRPTIPIEFSIKCLFLQYMYDLSDPALEDALIDRLSFQRFLGIGFETDIPDFSTIWKFRERLIEHNLFDKIFEEILRQLEEKKLILRRGTMVDATSVQSARRLKKKKSGEETPSHRTSQQDHDATSTKKGKKWYYGFKGHIGVDQGSNIIRKKKLTPANVHDMNERDNLFCGDERGVFGDKAYGDKELKQKCRKEGKYYGILDKGKRDHPLSSKQEKDNRQKSSVRSAVERPFAYFKHCCGWVRARYVKLKRNDLHFTFLCTIHNIRRGIALSKAKT
jgi:transposase, IS5 family